MSKIKIGDWLFDDFDYDRESDVLYLSIGSPRPGYGQETPEGHIWRFDTEGNFCGVTLVGVQHLLNHPEEMRITLPAPPRSESLPRPELNRVLAGAC